MVEEEERYIDGEGSEEERNIQSVEEKIYEDEQMRIKKRMMKIE